MVVVCVLNVCKGSLCVADETLSKVMTDDLSSVVNDEHMRLYKGSLQGFLKC